MLPKCNLEISEQEVAINDLEAFIKAEIDEKKQVPVFLETFEMATLLPLDKIPFAKIDQDIRFLVVFTPTMELRLEYNNGCMICRKIVEKQGLDYVYREYQLPIRSGATKEMQWYQNGSGCVLNREYYQQDDDGLYIFKTDRLAGFAS